MYTITCNLYVNASLICQCMQLCWCLHLMSPFSNEKSMWICTYFNFLCLSLGLYNEQDIVCAKQAADLHRCCQSPNLSPLTIEQKWLSILYHFHHQHHHHCRLCCCFSNAYCTFTWGKCLTKTKKNAHFLCKVSNSNFLCCMHLAVQVCSLCGMLWYRLVRVKLVYLVVVQLNNCIIGLQE